MENKIHSTEESIGPKERILQASLQLFVEQGYFNTNVPDISKLSRCSVGSIYHHFINKEEIAAQLFKDGLAKFRAALSKVMDVNQDVEKNIRAIVVAFLDFAESHHQLSRYLWLARHNEFIGSKVKHPTVIGFDELGRKLTVMLKKGIRTKQIPNLKAYIYWNIIFGIPLSFIRDWLDGYTQNSPREVSKILADACWGALQAAQP